MNLQWDASLIFINFLLIFKLGYFRCQFQVMIKNGLILQLSFLSEWSKFDQFIRIFDSKIIWFRYIDL